MACVIYGQVHPSLWVERADHLGNFFKKIAKIDPIAVDGQRQGLVELPHEVDARGDIVEQDANLPRREGLAAVVKSVALKANKTGQRGQVVAYPVIGLSQPDDPF